MSESLSEALPKEQERVRKIVAIYETVPNGQLAAAMMRKSLANAERASASGDVVAMLAAYKDLQEYDV